MNTDTRLEGLAMELDKYDELVAEGYRLAGHTTGHGVGEVAPLSIRQKHQKTVREQRSKLLAALGSTTDSAEAPTPSSDSELVEWLADERMECLLDDVELEQCEDNRCLVFDILRHKTILPMIQSPDAAYEKAAQVADKIEEKANRHNLHEKASGASASARAIRALKQGEG